MVITFQFKLVLVSLIYLIFSVKQQLFPAQNAPDLCFSARYSLQFEHNICHMKAMHTVFWKQENVGLLEVFP